MKRFFLFLSAVLLGGFLSTASFAEGEKSLTIVYSGFVAGKLDPLVG